MNKKQNHERPTKYCCKRIRHGAIALPESNTEPLSVINFYDYAIPKLMRRHIVALFLVFICSNAVVNAQQTSSTEQKNLQTVVVGLFDALSELNVDKAKSFCARDVTILENGKVWTFDSLALRITTRKAKSTDFKRINKFDFIETKISGETAWISYFNNAIITASGKTVSVKWLESVVLVKIGNEWKISLLHSTEISRTP